MEQHTVVNDRSRWQIVCDCCQRRLSMHEYYSLMLTEALERGWLRGSEVWPPMKLHEPWHWYCVTCCTLMRRQRIGLDSIDQMYLVLGGEG